MTLLLLTELTDLWPDLEATPRPGADQAQLQDAEAALGVTLHPDVRAVYGQHDGQDGDLPGLLLGLTWLPLGQALLEHATWMEVLEPDAGIPSHPEGAVTTANFHRAWLPIAGDGAGNGLAIDHAPGPAGTEGQVITFGPDESTHLVVAPNLITFLEWAATEVQAGQVTLTDGNLEWRGASSFLDEMHRHLE